MVNLYWSLPTKSARIAPENVIKRGSRGVARSHHVEISPLFAINHCLRVVHRREVKALQNIGDLTPANTQHGAHSSLGKTGTVG